MPSHAWDAEHYLRFADARTLPAIDLLSRIALEAPRRVVDLGCGPGNSTVPLKARWPGAAVTGLDSSEELLAAGRRDHPGIDFVTADIATWAATEPTDVIFANASLQWVGDHQRLMPRLFDQAAPGGVLAVQMPRNHDFATHRLMRQVAAEGEWRDRLEDARDPSPVKSPEFYYDLLAARSAAFTIWETNYIQIMDGPQAIIAWLHGTGLRPFPGAADRDRAAGLPRPLCGAVGRRLPGAGRRQGIAAIPAPVLHRHKTAIGVKASHKTRRRACCRSPIG